MEERERFNDPQEALRTAFDGLAAGIYVARVGKVVALNSNGTVNVQPQVRGKQMAPDSNVTEHNLPLLLDVVVCYMGGGGCTFTFTPQEGDECLVVFEDRNIDGWWDTGTIAAPLTARMHSLSDGFAIIGLRSRPRTLAAIAGTGATGAALRADDGGSYVALDPAGGVVNIVAPGGVNITGMVTVTGDVIADGVSLKTHRHTGNGAGNPTSTPIA